MSPQFFPVFYYYKMPSDKSRMVIVTDPMLATGGSACDAICRLKEDGYKNIRLMCLVAAPEGVKAVTEQHPDVDIYLAALDERLNEKNYIVPGLGDAGDRIFGADQTAAAAGAAVAALVIEKHIVALVQQIPGKFVVFCSKFTESVHDDHSTTAVFTLKIFIIKVFAVNTGESSFQPALA